MTKPKPSSREKKRYVVFSLKSTQQISFEQAKTAIIETIRTYIGEFGLAKARILVIKAHYKDNRGIFRTTLKQYQEVSASLAMMKSINNKSVTLQVLGISGILKKARYKFLESNTQSKKKN